jgi:hypothetical protein
VGAAPAVGASAYFFSRQISRTLGKFWASFLLPKKDKWRVSPSRSLTYFPENKESQPLKSSDLSCGD